ncbi:MAG: metallophosphoesterase family protein [Thermoplasmatota archaeon]
MIDGRGLKMRIAHISDLHVSSQYYVPKWGNSMVQWINDQEIDLVIISGDLTMDGHPHEYDLAMELVGSIDPPKLVVPGNHDAKNKGYEVFEEIFGTRKPFFHNDMVAILGLDSSEPDIDEGQIGRHDYRSIREKLDTDKATILVMHHHIVPVPGTGRERNILTDAGDVLKICVENGIDLVLSGHRHLPWVWRIHHTHFVTAGTACTRRLMGRTGPSFNLIRILEDGIEMERIDTRDLGSEHLMKAPLAPRLHSHP